MQPTKLSTQSHAWQLIMHKYWPTINRVTEAVKKLQQSPDTTKRHPSKATSIISTPRVKKKQDTLFSRITSPNNDRSSKFLTDRLSSDCATRRSLKIPPHLKHVATLFCETLMFKN